MKKINIKVIVSLSAMLFLLTASSAFAQQGSPVAQEISAMSKFAQQIFGINEKKSDSLINIEQAMEANAVEEEIQKKENSNDENTEELANTIDIENVNFIPKTIKSDEETENTEELAQKENSIYKNLNLKEEERETPIVLPSFFLR